MKQKPMDPQPSMMPEQESGAPETCRGARRAANAAITVAVIACVLLVNILFSFVADRFMWQVDATVTRYTTRADVSMYRPTEQFLTVVRDYAIPMVEKVNAERAAAGEQPLTINVIFCTERDRVWEADKLRMIQYTALALQKEFPDAVRVSYVNIAENPSAVQKYKANSASNIYPHQIIFEFGTEYRVCSYDYFFLKSDESSTDHWAYNGEQDMASLLLAITRAASPIAGFITNHGENVEACTSLRNLVERAGYDVINLDLSRDEIPADCRLLISYDPTSDFMGLGNAAYVEGDPSEIDKLDKFLDKAYSFMLFVDNDTPTLPVLEEYLEEWGVTVSRTENAAGEVDNYTIRDTVQKLDKDGYTPIANYATAGSGASLTQDMRDVSYPPKVVFPNATAIELSDSFRETFVDADETAGTEAYRYGLYYRNGVSRYLYDVLNTGMNAVAEAHGEQQEIATEKDPFRLMTLSAENRTVKETEYLTANEPSYVAVFASTEFASNAVLDSAAYGNADVLLSTLRAMGREVMPANLEFKAFKNYEVDVDVYTPDPTTNVVTTVALTLLPMLICAAIGVYVSVTRKYR